MAKGNIVLGNYTASSWLSDINTYLTSTTYVPAYDCDTSDAAIGYPKKFNASSGYGRSRINYASVEYVGSSDFAECESAGLADFVPGGRNNSTGNFGNI